MSVAIDANLLVYASDEHSPFYARARAFLGDCLSGQDLICLTWPVVTAYLRLTTHPRISRLPLPPEVAMANMDRLLGLPHVRVLSEEEGFWDVYRDTVKDLAVRGNLVSDAHLVALLRQHGVRTLFTNDRDFLKFRVLDVRNPFQS